MDTSYVDSDCDTDSLCRTPGSFTRSDMDKPCENYDEENDLILKRVLELSKQDCEKEGKVCVDESDVKMKGIVCDPIEVCDIPSEYLTRPSPVKRNHDERVTLRRFFDDSTTKHATAPIKYATTSSIDHKIECDEDNELMSVETAHCDTTDIEHTKSISKNTEYGVEDSRIRSFYDRSRRSKSTNSTYDSDSNKRSFVKPKQTNARDQDDFFQVFTFDHDFDTYVGFCETISTETLHEHGKKSRKKQTFMDHLNKIIFAAKLYTTNKHIIDTIAKFIDVNDMQNLSVSKIREQFVKNARIVDVANSVKECKQKVEISRSKSTMSTRRHSPPSFHYSRDMTRPILRSPYSCQTDVFDRFNKRDILSSSRTLSHQRCIPFESQANAGAGIDPKFANMRFHPPEYKYKVMKCKDPSTRH